MHKKTRVRIFMVRGHKALSSSRRKKVETFTLLRQTERNVQNQQFCIVRFGFKKRETSKFLRTFASDLNKWSCW